MKLEDKQRLAQEEESEAKRLAIMMMKKREKYLYQKIMFGKRRKIREVSSGMWLSSGQTLAHLAKTCRLWSSFGLVWIYTAGNRNQGLTLESPDH